MAKRTREIYKLYDEASHHLSTLAGEIDASKIDKLLSNLYSPGPSFQYIFDFGTRQFVYVSKNVEDILGVKNKNFTPEDFMQRLHHVDFKHFLHCEEIARYFLFSHIKKERLPDYKVTYQIRLRDKTAEYKMFLHQAIALTWDEDYNMSTVLANHSIINHITTVNNNKMSFIDITGKHSFYGIRNIEGLKLYSKNRKLVSKRELQVLSLISEGFSSSEIADYLNISIQTVTTHRKNILSKTNFRNMGQATSHYIREGLI